MEKRVVTESASKPLWRSFCHAHKHTRRHPATLKALKYQTSECQGWVQNIWLSKYAQRRKKIKYIWNRETFSLYSSSKDPFSVSDKKGSVSWDSALWWLIWCLSSGAGGICCRRVLFVAGGLLVGAIWRQIWAAASRKFGGKEFPASWARVRMCGPSQWTAKVQRS